MDFVDPLAVEASDGIKCLFRHFIPISSSNFSSATPTYPSATLSAYTEID